MNLTIEDIAHSFRQFNQAYFRNELPLPRFVLSKSKTRLGSFSCKRKLTCRGYRLTDFTIRLSVYYQMAEREVQNVLLHEMIHYYIAYTRTRDTSAHGVVFRQMMKELNEKHGWHITVTSNTKGWEPTVPKKKKTRLVLAIKNTDGNCFLSVVNPKYQPVLEQQIQRVRVIVWHRWITTDSELFANYPAVRSLRGRRVKPEDFPEIF